jgi:NitT/TauT family transport system permease protein
MSSRVLLTLLGGIVILAVWEGLVHALQVPLYVLPPPSAIFTALLTHAPRIFTAAGATFLWAMLALLFASLGGLLLAFVFHRVPLLERAFGPYALALQATPIVAIAPLFVIWAGVEHPQNAIILLASIAGFFPAFASSGAGLRAVEPGHDRLFRLLKAKPWDRFVRLELPTMAPFLFAGLKTAAGLSLVGAVVAEFVAGSGASGGLAWLILEAGNRLQTDVLFAGLITLGVLGVGLSVAFDALERLWRS